MKKELEQLSEEKAKEFYLYGYEGSETTAFSHGAEWFHDELGYQFTKEDMRKCWEAARKYFEGKSDKNFNDFIDSN